MVQYSIYMYIYIYKQNVSRERNYIDNIIWDNRKLIELVIDNKD